MWPGGAYVQITVVCWIYSRQCQILVSWRGMCIVYPMPVGIDYRAMVFRDRETAGIARKNPLGGSTSTGRILDPRDLRVAGIAMIRAKATDNLW
jgi:hypothetical protein